MKRRQRGVALITVMLLLVGLGLVAGSAAMLGLSLWVEADHTASRAREHYRAESALNRAVWLLKLDLAENADRTLGVNDYQNRMIRHERFPADGVDRALKIGGKMIPIRILDGAAGISLMPLATLGDRLSEIRQQDNRDRMVNFSDTTAFNNFLERLADALDADSFRRLNGMEQEEYDKNGMAFLPRDGEWEFREELLMVPGAADLQAVENGFWHRFNVIPPHGLDEVPARPSLYSSAPEMIRRTAELDDRELAKFEAAREIWRRERIALSKSLDVVLYSKLTETLSTGESGLYRIEIGRGEGPAGVGMTAVLKPLPGTRFLEFYEIVRY